MKSQIISKRILGLGALLALLSFAPVRLWSQTNAPRIFSASPLEAAVGVDRATITFSATGVLNSLVLRWNGSDRPTTLVNGNLTATVGAADLATPGFAYVSVVDRSTGTTIWNALFWKYVSLATNDLAYDKVRNRIYASLPSTATAYGNNIVAIDPTSGAVAASVFVGSEPGALAITDACDYLYVSLDGAAAVRQVDLSSFTAGLQFGLGKDSGGAPLYAASLRVVPGRSDSVLAVRRTSSSSFTNGLAVYDNGVMRSKVTSATTNDATNVVFGDASTAYGVSQFQGMLLRYPIDGAGVSTGVPVIGGITGNVAAADGGRIYTSGGQVIDPKIPALIGKYAASGLVLPDGDRGRTYVVPQNFGSSTGGIQAFDQATLVPLGTISLTTGAWTSLLRWGTDGIAFRRDTRLESTKLPQIYIFRTALAGPVPVVNAAVHGATGKSAKAVPGEIVTFYGSALGPLSPLSGILTTPSLIGATVGDIKVMFGGNAAPILYASHGQTNVVVPYAVSGRSSIPVTLYNTGIPSAAVMLDVAEVAPGVFTMDGSGRGPAIALNENGSLNTAASPAPAGSVIVLYGTGAGNASPAVADGTIAGASPSKPVSAVSVTIGGRPADVLYAGDAPGLVSGALQINARIPAGVSGNAAVVLTVGDAASPSGVTISVQ